MRPLVERYRQIRGRSVALARPLAIDDQLAQSMPDVSPTKWHLAHTTWYFERFVLRDDPEYTPVDPRHDFLFNSYYDAIGPRHPRARRSLITRPTLAEIHAYREAVDQAMEALLAGPLADALAFVVEVGLHHEEQHQELILTDIKHVLGTSLFKAPYRESKSAPARRPAPALAWVEHPEGLATIGHDGGGFAFDNEGPRHRAFVEAFALASRPVTCGEFAEFIADGGYRTPSLWVSEGWAAVKGAGWEAPLYWEGPADERRVYTLAGVQELDPAAPVCHLSWYEADAYARWAGARLPTEVEWEVAAAGADARPGHDAGDPYHHPRAAAGEGLQALLGGVWEWTQSPYVAYPRYRPWPGALGEYNGKFMSSQMVLRGGSCLTPPGHVRRTYRNFFPPAARWQMSGVRLARWS
ncbi:MAG: ergothioneine biosynthesis protein EgtB [Nannocystaceae bacterium]